MYSFIYHLSNGASAPAASPPRIADVDGRWQKRRRHERYWKDLEAILGVRGGSWGVWGRSRGILGALGVSQGFLERLGVVLGASWAVSGSSWAVLGPSWGQLGPCWARLGASWASLGPSWGRLGAPWGSARGLLERGWSAILANPSVYTRIYKNLREDSDSWRSRSPGEE